MIIEKEAIGTNYIDRRFFTKSARNALIQIYENYKKQNKSISILLPSYIGLSKVEGSGVFDPVIQCGVKYSFYKVDDRLVPDLRDIKNLLMTNKYDFILLIHYFGCPQLDIVSFVELCHSYNVMVIEDCAHCLIGYQNGRRLGSFGDFSIFSIHKILPTKSGGFMYCNRNIIEVEIAQENLISLEDISKFTNFNLEKAINHRLKNYVYVLESIKDNNLLIPFFETIPNEIFPLNCPVIVKNGLRENLYFALLEKGIKPTALYHTLIPQINETKYPDSFFVSRNILNLPVHQDISDIDLDNYVKIIKETSLEVENGEKKQ